ncbi:phage portal protein [Pseudoalteromonas sp. ACER1]|uniref:phage portal protein n=3 Tax=Pseudoalteromonas TaxID=53246 RepID=UPI001F1E7F3B|nr:MULTISPECIES: phage portal protein [unclassified Pseudoalteromonas]MCF2846548.1 phage portal protein [Pseudoalteromonas sp. PAST1]MCO7210019.1 phage portal protein [Pseudoalteromonas sp. ACER1]
MGLLDKILGRGDNNQQQTPEVRDYEQPEQAARKLSPQQIAAQKRYAASKSDRLFKNPIGYGLSVDETLRRDVERLRAASRSAGEDVGYIKKYFGMVQTHIVGDKGFRLQSQIRNAQGELDKDANKSVELAYKEFCRKGFCEISGRMNMTEADQLIAKTVSQDGDMLIRHIDNAPNKFGYAFQLIEADLLDVNLYKVLSNGHVIKMGVEQDGFGRHLAYHILTNHPGEYTWSTGGRRYIRVPADEIVLPFPMWRPGQTRGVPWAHASLLDMHDIRGFREATLVSARVGASNMLIYERDPDQPPPEDDENWENGEFIQELEPGKSNVVPDGFKARESRFDMPDDSTGDFQKAILRGAASGVDANYNVLANDFEGVSWSTLRQAVIEDREHWKRLQGWYISQIKNVIYERWLRNALIRNQIKGLYAYDLERANHYQFYGRRWQWVDPLKDEQAISESYKNFTVNPMEVLQDKGLDPQELAEGWQNFLELMGDNIQLAQSIGLIKGSSVKANEPPPKEDEE